MKGHKVLELRSKAFKESPVDIQRHCPSYIDLCNCEVTECNKDYCKECWESALEKDYPLVAKIFPPTIDGLIFDENATLVINERVYTFKELKKLLR